jgi:DNA-binding SARP family transcriptional activator
MKFAILGPVEARADDGALMTFGRTQQTAALAVLLLRAGKSCSHGWLLEALWGDAQPRSGTALRNLILDVRTTLGRHGSRDRLETRPGAYLFRADPGELDLETWRTLQQQGLAAQDRGDVRGAARLLQQALSLWREPFLRDLPDTPPIAVETDRLLSERRDTRDALVDARLALGQHREVVGELRATVSGETLNEHAWAQLMLALYRSGRPAETLVAYSKVRQLLAAEMGTDPGPEIEDLIGRVRQNDRALAMPTAAVTSGADPAPPWIPVCQLPAEPPDFTGRAAETAVLARRLADAAMTVTVVSGLAGAGKTSLALHAAHQARGRFGDGQLYASMGGPLASRDPQDVLSEMLRALGVPPDGLPAPGQERAAMYRSMLAGRKVLVVLDDVAGTAQVGPLLPGTAGSAVIVTSRFRLADLDGAFRVEVGPLSPGEAAALLGKIAGREPGGDPDEVGAADAMAAACGYLPLPVRIAGARLAARPQLRITALARSLADSGRVLNELAIGDMSVRDRIAGSYRALDERARRAWRLLATHAPEEMPEWLSGALLGEPDGTGATEELVSAGMLVEVGHGSLPRYRMPALWRAYAAEQLEPGDLVLTAPALSCLYTGWLELADHASRWMPHLPHLPDLPHLACTVAPASAVASTRAEATAWFDTERPNLMGIIRRAIDDGRADLAADLASRMLGYQCATARHEEAQGLWLAITYAAAEDKSAAARARYRLAVLEADQGRWVAALRRLDGCITAFADSGDQRSLGDAEGLAARCAEADWDLGAALRHAERSLPSARAAADARLTSLSLSVYGTVLSSLGRGKEGTASCREAVDIAASLDHSCQELAAAALKRARRSAGRLAPEGQQDRRPGLFAAGLTQSSGEIPLPGLPALWAGRGDPGADLGGLARVAFQAMQASRRQDVAFPARAAAA